MDREIGFKTLEKKQNNLFNFVTCNIKHISINAEFINVKFEHKKGGEQNVHPPRQKLSLTAFRFRAYE